MKRIVKSTLSVVLSATMILSGLSGFVGFKPITEPIEAKAATGNYGLVSDVQDAAILHCWNWSYATIEQHLQLIAESGYSAIQTSPASQPKDYKWEGVVGTDVGTPGKGGTGNWWKVYQPVTISVCDNGETWFGTKDELKSLCAKAEEYGIKVIVDIVANHLGNISGWKNSLTDVSPQVGEFWNPNMLTDESYWHINDLQVWMSDGRKDITQGSMGMPDLNTGDSRVQNYYKDFLIELIDCGVDGFRFDAAKHIETPDDDPSYASDFWPNVLNPAESYYNQKTGGDLYVYGEILNTVGDGFSINSYTKYMSVTDNSAGNQCLDSFRNNQVGNISMHHPVDKSVLWAESHDTYMNEASRYGSDKSIVRTWSYVANKNGAAALYFVRPYYSKDVLTGDVDGSFREDLETSLVQAQMGECSTYTWASNEVAAINHFRNRMTGQSESYGSSGNIGYCKRGNGIILVNMDGAGSVSLGSQGLSNGTYTDEVSGNTFTVSNGTLSGTIGSEQGVAVIYQNVMPNPNPNRPVQISTSVSNGSIYYTNGLDITINAKNATSASYTATTGESGTFTGEKEITIGKGLADGQTVTLTITATNAYGTVNKELTFTKQTKNVEITSSKADGSKFYTDGVEVTIEATGADNASYSVSNGVQGSFTDSITLTVGEGLSDGETVTITVTGTNSKGTVTETFTYTKSENQLGTTVLFKNTAGWTTVNAYAWNDTVTPSVNNGVWPGVSMTVFDEANQIYMIEFESADQFNNIIFNNGSVKTGDLVIPGMGYIYDFSTSSWSEYAEPSKPSVSSTLSGGELSAATSVTYTVKDATSASYTINGGNAVNFTDSVTLTVGNNEKDVVVITATNAQGTTTKTYTYTCNKKETLSANAVADKTTTSVGDKVKFTATATGGTAPYTYSYIVNNQTTGEWYRFVDNSTSPSFTWTAVSAGTRTFYCDVKDATGKIVRTSAINVVTSNQVKPLTVTSTVTKNDIVVGDKIKITATATGGTAPYTYSYIVNNQTTGEWYRFVDNSSSNTFEWTAGSAGERYFYVDVKDATGKIVRANAIKVNTSDNSSNLTITAGSSASSVELGASVAILANASGGTGSYTYSFLVHNKTNGSWFRLSGFEESNLCVWSAASAGDRDFYVEVKDGTGKVVRSNAINVVVK